MKISRILLIIIAYFVVGIIYAIIGYLSMITIESEITFSPLIGIPLMVLYWPWMVYADILHIGVMLRDIVALISIGLIILLFCIVFIIEKKQKS